MTWVKLDNRAVHHTKLRRVGPVAGWLWIAGLSHCNDAATNGRIDKRDLAALYVSEHFPKRAATLASQKLVEVGLWEDCGDHWMVHDYADYQAPALRDAVAERREKAAARKRAQRERERAQRDTEVGQDLVKSGTYATQDLAKNERVPSNIIHLQDMSRRDAAVSHTPPDPDLRSDPSDQGACSPLCPPAKAKRTRKLTPRDHVRLRLVELFNALYEPRYGKRSEPTSVAYCASAVTTFLNPDGTCDEEAAVASMRVYLDDTYLAARSGYSFDGWIRRCAASLTKARPAARVCNHVNRVTYDH